jgi:lipoprotein-releasing system permease protein
MYRTFLSWRYMVARRTNLIGVVGIMVGVGALIMILSIMSGFLAESRKALRGSLADLIIEPLALRHPDGHVAQHEAKAILDVVRADPRVASAAAELAWLGVLAKTGDEADFSEIRFADPESSGYAALQLVGIDVEDEYKTTELRAALERESKFGSNRVADIEHPFAPPPGYAPEGRPAASILIGEQLAALWFLPRGTEVNLLTPTPDPKTGEFKPTNRRFVVAGTFATRENEMDLQRVYLDRRELQDLIGSSREFSQILVKVHDYAHDGAAVRDDLREKLAAARLIRGTPKEVRTWEDYKKTLLGAIENEKVLMAIMLSLVLVVAGFTVFAILSMMVTEKRRDIGILSALGATPRGILVLFLLIGFWDALVGAALGAALGTWLAIEIDPIERWLSKTFGVEIFDRSVYLFSYIPSVVDPKAVALIVLGAFLCTLLFASIPAWKAGRMHPLDALRYE